MIHAGTSVRSSRLFRLLKMLLPAAPGPTSEEAHVLSDHVYTVANRPYHEIASLLGRSRRERVKGPSGRLFVLTIRVSDGARGDGTLIVQGRIRPASSLGLVQIVERVRVGTNGPTAGACSITPGGAS